jgi:PAS domain S-box-containing protein
MFTNLNLLTMKLFLDFLRHLFYANDFVPRWVCGNWTAFHGWLYIISNIGIFAAYFTIPLILFFYIRKSKISQFKQVYIWFALFIFFCGTTHLIDAIIFWFPVYRINAITLAFTALISWTTIFVVIRHLPKALEYKSPEELQKTIQAQTAELQLAYKKIEQSEKQFRTLVNSNPDVITCIGRDLKYKFINDAILRMRKIKIEDIVGKSMYEVVNKDDTINNDRFINYIQKAFETGQSQMFEFETHTNSSHKSYFNLQIIPLKNENQVDFEDVLTITKDITLQKLNETKLNENIQNLEMLAKKLENKRRVLEDFTYIVSHNLRSPVANITALLGLMKVETDPAYKDVLFSKINQASERLSDTVQDLTTVVQVRQNKDIERTLLYFEDILSHHLTSLETQIQEANAQIISDFRNCPSIEYPKIYLESIFLNLLTNAIKYKSKARQLVIKLTSHKDQNGLITLICEDNGLGIDMKRFGNKLFGLNKIFHEHKDAKGVGLFITRNQIETMGGSIYAESEVNVGTKFIVNFNS